MNQKEKRDLFRKTKRRRRRSSDKAEVEASSLEAVSTPVDTVPYQKKSNPRDTIQERKLPLVTENKVTVVVVSTSERGVYDDLDATVISLILKARNYFLQH